jgi:hypothetical protein
VDVDQYTGKAGERIDVFVQDATCQRVKVTVLDPTQGGANALGAVVEEEEAQRAVEMKQEFAVNCLTPIQEGN